MIKLTFEQLRGLSRRSLVRIIQMTIDSSVDGNGMNRRQLAQIIWDANA